MNVLDCLIEALLAIPAPGIWTKSIIPGIRAYGLIESDALLNNLHSILYITAFYHLVFLLSAWFVFPRISQWRIDCLLAEEKEKDIKVEHKYSRTQRAKSLSNQAALHLVSFSQTIIVLYLSISFLISHERSVIPYPDPASRIFDETRETRVICIFAIGYFIWDALISAAYSTLPFVMHGVVSTAMYAIGIKPYLQYYAPVFLIFELSNPFLNIRWFALKYLPSENQICSRFQLFNNLIFLVTFFLGRIAWGWYQIGCLCYDFYMVSADPRYLYWDSLIIVAGNLVLDVLNAYWFKTMVGVAIKAIKGGAQKKHDDVKKAC
ncbi:similar to Saccharomyces cerevisiae YPR114W Putative protein of unknown function [Maudiozyma barnettii]|uniref:TLC domain-containing protein n=1 Tax=Maudiozyma barnettii TaxID=61262 RepID=A0A8H2ZF87_9SACH|nr:hypothetical protein [Kazachstania barnettii]CAB4252085.1 similar to Saccharomyces cerevisiae YPR114W Putative protein of unknown function [Kazachstania barnettii]CAD1778587.1 similar to Saccharomyces cerevisiae YPR114W Putative protein of unknown function [Kazachstania barnettii]